MKKKKSIYTFLSHKKKMLQERKNSKEEKIIKIKRVEKRKKKIN